MTRKWTQHQWRVSQAGATEDRLINVTWKLNIKLKEKKKAETRRKYLWYTQQMVTISANIHNKFPSFMKTQRQKSVKEHEWIAVSWRHCWRGRAWNAQLHAHSRRRTVKLDSTWLSRTYLFSVKIQACGLSILPESNSAIYLKACSYSGNQRSGAHSVITHSCALESHSLQFHLQ